MSENATLYHLDLTEGEFSMLKDVAKLQEYNSARYTPHGQLDLMFLLRKIEQAEEAKS